jgi:hypothetical protein
MMIMVVVASSLVIDGWLDDEEDTNDYDNLSDSTSGKPKDNQNIKPLASLAFIHPPLWAHC